MSMDGNSTSWQKFDDDVEYKQMKNTHGSAKIGGFAHRMGRASASADFSKQRSQESCMEYRVVIEQDENGVFIAVCPALLGCTARGKTHAEALANIKDAITVCLASLKKHTESATPPISVKRIENRA
jgi:predicted RNase H-like HicB family nuclease